MEHKAGKAHDHVKPSPPLVGDGMQPHAPWFEMGDIEAESQPC